MDLKPREWFSLEHAANEHGYMPYYKIYMYRGELENAAMELMIAPFFERAMEDDRGYDFICVNLGRMRWRKNPERSLLKEVTRSEKDS